MNGSWIKGKISSASEILGLKKPEPEPSFSIFNMVNNDKSYTKAIVAMGIGALLFLFSIFSLPTLIISPSKFTLFFTLSMISLLVALAFFNGPRTYLNKLFEKKNRIKTSVLLGSMFLSLYFSLINESYLLSLLFCFIEVSIILI